MKHFKAFLTIRYFAVGKRHLTIDLKNLNIAQRAYFEYLNQWYCVSICRKPSYKLSFEENCNSERFKKLEKQWPEYWPHIGKSLFLSFYKRREEEKESGK